MTDSDAERLVETAWSAGIRSFDTAPLYGSGLSELRLGRALKQFPRNEYSVSTKVGRLLVPGAVPPEFPESRPLSAVFDFSERGVFESLETSLERLGLDHVDTVLLHDPESHMYQAFHEAIPTCRTMISAGLAKSMGVGTNYPHTAIELLQLTRIDTVLIAGKWTLLNREAGAALFPLAVSHNVRVLNAGIFNSGLLADPGSGQATFDYAPPSALASQAAQRMQRECAKFGLTLATAAVMHAFDHRAVSAVVVGAATPAQLTQAVVASTGQLPNDLRNSLDSIQAEFSEHSLLEQKRD